MPRARVGGSIVRLPTVKLRRGNVPSGMITNTMVDYALIKEQEECLTDAINRLSISIPNPGEFSASFRDLKRALEIAHITLYDLETENIYHDDR